MNEALSIVFNPTKGMTLIELLVTLFLAMLMIAVGTPGFLTLQQGQAQRSAIQQLYGVIQFARSLAITDATTVTVCASTNLVSCSSNRNLANGAVILSENTDGSKSLVRVIDAIKAKDFFIEFTDFPSNSQIEFSDTGEINMTSAASITFCDPRGSQFGAALIVNPLGLVRKATDDDNDEVINLHNQNNIYCHS